MGFPYKIERFLLGFRVYILHYQKDPKLWELLYILYLLSVM